MDDNKKQCQVFDFVSIKEAIEEKENGFESQVSDEEWEDCVYTLFIFMSENGYDPHKQSEIIEFVKDYFPDLPYNYKEDWPITKNLWEKEERQVYRSLTRQYKQEGYDIKEAKKLAREETNEIMLDKKEFAENLYQQALEDFDW